MFDWIADAAPARDVAWDCGAGSGQATLPLAERFAHVIGTDASAEQLSQAPTHPRITWRVAPAEASGLDAASVDAVTVAQALHWFDLSQFWVEVRRVAKPGALVAAWSYGIVSIDDPAITRTIRNFHDGIVGPYWPIERGFVDARYQSIEIPFTRLEPPAIDLQVTWEFEQLLGYLRTWSATRRYIDAIGTDPVTPFAETLAPAWGNSARRVHWPLTILAARVD